jgi:WD40 repeat protein
LARLGTIRFRASGPTRCLALSPDGKFVATAGESLYEAHPEYPIRIWDTATGKEVGQYRGHLGPPAAIVFSPDGKSLASFAVGTLGNEFRDEIRLWDVTRGKLLRVLSGPQMDAGNRREARLRLAFSPDGERLASFGVDKSIRLWESATGNELRSWPEPVGASALTFSPDGKVLGYGREQTLRLLDVATGRASQIEVRDVRFGVEGLQFSPDGKTVILGYSMPRLPFDGNKIRWKRNIRWLEGATGKELRHVEGGLLASSPQGKWLALRQQRDLLLWDMVADREAHRFPLEDASLADYEQDHFAGSLSADGNILAVPDGARIRILDTRTGKERSLFPGHSDEVVFVGFSSNGRRLISAADRSIRIWDPATGKQVGEMRGHEQSICGAARTVDGKTLATGAPDATIRLWDLEARKEVRRLAVAPPCPALAFSPDGKRLAAAFRAPVGISLFDVASGSERLHFNNFDRSGQAIAFSPDGRTLAELSSRLTLYDPDSSELLCEFKEMQEIDRCQTGMTLSPDGRMVATGYWQDDQQSRRFPTVSLWEMASGKLIAGFRGHKHPACSFAFTHNGKVVASGGSDGTVRLWQVASGRELRKFEGHRGSVLSLDFSPDDKLLASGGTDTSILIWDVAEFADNRSSPGARLSHEELDKLWTELGAENAAVAYGALWQLAAGGKPAVSFLKEQLCPPGVSEQRIKQLIAELDAEQFDARQRATEELARVGLQAEPLLRKALLQPSSPELQLRVERLLAKLQNPGEGRATEALRQLRAIQALEYGQTPDARELLRTLAETEPAAPRGREARAALQRLEGQKVPSDTHK